MRDDKTVWGLILGSVLLQWYVMYTSDLFETGLPFSTGLLGADTGGGNATQVLYAIIPVPFLLWLFSGRAEEIVSGYGKVYIIRNYSREKLLFKEICVMLLYTGLIQGFTWMVFQGFSHDSWESLTFQVQIKVVMMYLLALMTALLLQFCLELLIGRVYGQIVTLVYFAWSLFIYGMKGEDGVTLAVRLALFPNLGFAMRSGAMDSENSRLFFYSLTGLLLICISLIYISLKILNKKDIM